MYQELAPKDEVFCPDNRSKNTKTLREEERERESGGGSFMYGQRPIGSKTTFLTQLMIKPIDRSEYQHSSTRMAQPPCTAQPVSCIITRIHRSIPHSAYDPPHKARSSSCAVTHTEDGHYPSIICPRFVRHIPTLLSIKNCWCHGARVSEPLHRIVLDMG